MEKRSRLAPEVRRNQIVDAAATIALEQGYLPIPLEKLGEAAGVSKALVYAYFPTQVDLFNAILERELSALLAAGLDEASRRADLQDAALGCALIYFDHVAATGALAHIILRDRYMVGHVSARNRSMRDRIIGRLARLARRELRLGAKENIAAINLIITVPEEAGRLAHAGEMAPARARDLCAQLVLSSLGAFAPSTN